VKKLKILSLVLVLLFFGSTLAIATTNWTTSENYEMEVFGYNVYKFQGSGHYAIFYPLPNGTVRLLKMGKVGALPVFVKIPRGAWLKEYSKNPMVLKALPTPVVVFVNDKGIGVESLHGSRITLKPFQIPTRPEPLSIKPCPGGYVPVGSRYCVPKDPTSNWVDVIASKTVTEPISFLSLEIDNKVLGDVVFTMWLFLSESTYSYWTVGIDLGGIEVRSAKVGENFEGKSLDIEYSTPGTITPNNPTWSRYLNLYVKYQVVVFGVLAYDRYTGKFTKIPITATYPLEILSTGKYTIHETQNGPTYVEGNPNGLFSPQITSQPQYYRIPTQVDLERKYVSAEGGRRTLVDKRSVSYSELSSSSSISIPIGPLAVNELESIGVLSKYPGVLRELEIVSLTLGFHKMSGEISGFHYFLSAIPQRDCSVLSYKITLRTQDYQHVGVPMLLVTVTDGNSGGLCNPQTGVCISSHDGNGIDR